MLFPGWAPAIAGHLIDIDSGFQEDFDRLLIVRARGVDHGGQFATIRWILTPASETKRRCGIVTLIIGGSGALLLYLLFAKALRITEVTELTSGLRSRLGR